MTVTCTLFSIFATKTLVAVLMSSAHAEDDGKPVLMKLPEINFVDDKTGKPIGIQQHIGRRPIAAFGTSDGDLQMLQ